jgi:HEAT repeats
MTKRWCSLALCVLTAFLAVSLGELFYHSQLVGWWRGEAIYRGKYTNGSRTEMRRWEIVGLSGDTRSHNWHYARVPSRWETWVQNLTGRLANSRDFAFPLVDADADALPVIRELLCDPDARIRLMVTSLLRGMGAEGAFALPDLLDRLADDDDDVRIEAQVALLAIGGKK